MSAIPAYPKIVHAITGVIYIPILVILVMKPGLEACGVGVGDSTQVDEP